MADKKDKRNSFVSIHWLLNPTVISILAIKNKLLDHPLSVLNIFCHRR